MGEISMPSRRKGHIIQVWKPAYVDPLNIKSAEMTSAWGTRVYLEERHARWYGVRREGLTRREAVKLAKEYQRLGLDTRVVHVKADYTKTVTDFFKKKS
jgi:hypothetical protein